METCRKITKGRCLLSVAASHFSTPLPPIYIWSDRAKVFLSGKRQLLLNIHEQRQLVPCPFIFLIKPQMLGSIVSGIHGESAHGMELVTRAFGYRGAELNRWHEAVLSNDLYSDETRGRWGLYKDSIIWMLCMWVYLYAFLIYCVLLKICQSWLLPAQACSYSAGAQSKDY